MSDQDKLDSEVSVIDALIKQTAKLVSSDDIDSVQFDYNTNGKPVVTVVFKSTVSDAVLDAATDNLKNAARPFKVNITVDGTSALQSISEASRGGKGNDSEVATTCFDCDSSRKSSASGKIVIGIAVALVVVLVLVVFVSKKRGVQEDEVRSGGVENTAYGKSEFVLNMDNSPEYASAEEPDDFVVAQQQLEMFGATSGGTSKLHGMTSSVVPMLDLSTGQVLNVQRKTGPKRVLSNSIVYGTDELRAEPVYIAETSNDIGGMPVYSNSVFGPLARRGTDWDMAEGALSNHAMTRRVSTKSTLSQLSNLEELYSAVAADSSQSPQLVLTPPQSPQSPGWASDGEHGMSRRVSELSLC